jgi:hypothetical protein
MEVPMTSQESAKDEDMVFRIKAALLPKPDAWMRDLDEKVAEEQVRTGKFFNGSPLNEGVVRVVKDSLEQGEPMPYHGAIGGAYAYCFIPTGLGSVVKVKNTVTGDEIDLTDYDEC